MKAMKCSGKEYNLMFHSDVYKIQHEIELLSASQNVSIGLGLIRTSRNAKAMIVARFIYILPNVMK